MSRRSLPRARQPVRRLAGAVLAGLVLVLPACSGDGDGAAPRQAPTRSEVVGAEATSRPAVELQAALTAVLVERVHVVATTTDAIGQDGGALTTPTVEAARRALDTASTALADVLGATYSEARTPLREALQREDRLLAEHAAALTTGRQPEAERLRAELGTAQQQVARVVRRVVPTLDAGEVAEQLSVDVAVQQALGAPTRYADLREAGSEAARTARLLAAGVAEDRDLGPVSTPAALLRADVTRLLTEHVQLVGALAREDAAGRGPARSALQDNADELSDVLGELYPAARRPFLRSWSAHLDRLEAYAASRASGGAAPAEAGTVRGYPAELARLLAEHVDGLPASSSQSELERALVSQLRAVDAARSPDGPVVLQRATADVLPAAALVTAAIAEHLRLS